MFNPSLALIAVLVWLACSAPVFIAFATSITQ
jgi:hypothetical protein